MSLYVAAFILTNIIQIMPEEIGGFAAPDTIIISQRLPVTRSGKIMRRILRKIVAGEKDSLGDTSTLADPTVIDILIEKVEALQIKK